MAQSQLFEVPVFRWLIRKLGAFPVRRGEIDTEAIRYALDILRDGEALLVFPEGRRGDGKHLLQANRGVVFLASKSGAAVVPVGVCGTLRFLPKGAKLPSRSRITVVFGEPFTYAEVEAAVGKEKAKERFGALLMQKIRSLMAEGMGPLEPAPDLHADDRRAFAEESAHGDAL